MKPRRIGPLARRLLLVGGMAGCVSACVIPPPGDFAEADAGPSSPPVIVSAADPYEFPEMNVVRTDPPRLALTLRDVDLEDTLFVRLYVDYGLPVESNFAASCTAVPSGMQERIADCATSTLCNQITDEAPHFLEAMVADLEFLSDSDPLAEGQPPFRALPPTAAYSFRSWMMTCIAPQ